MNLPILIYLADISSGIKDFTGAIAVIFIIVIGIIIFLWMITNDGYNNEKHAEVDIFLKYLTKKSWIIAIMLMISISIPSQTTIYMMLGSSYLADSKIPSQVSEILDLKLKDVLKELKKENKND